jgi:hypothetical protein
MPSFSAVIGDWLNMGVASRNYTVRWRARACPVRTGHIAGMNHTRLMAVERNGYWSQNITASRKIVGSLPHTSVTSVNRMRVTHSRRWQQHGKKSLNSAGLDSKSNWAAQARSRSSQSLAALRTYAFAICSTSDTMDRRKDLSSIEINALVRSIPSRVLNSR